MIRRILASLQRRLRTHTEARANRALAARFARAGATVDQVCRAIGSLAPRIDNAGLLRLGRRTAWQGTTLRTEVHVAAGATLEIGAGTFVNQGVTIAAHRAIVIGPDCLIGEQVTIHDSSFHPVAPARPAKTVPVRLGRNVWLGHRAIVLPGVEIGDHTVVGAGAVVARSLPSRCVAVGVPARVVATFDCPDDWKRA